MSMQKLPKKDQNIRLGRNVHTRLLVRLKFFTKKKEPVFFDEHRPMIEYQFAQTLHNLGASLIYLACHEQEVECLVQYPPALSVGTLVNALKSQTSRHLNKTLGEEWAKLHSPLWSSGYEAFSEHLLT